eukprot:11014883-Alexandrium_andersonii.AAC.1
MPQCLVDALQSEVKALRAAAASSRPLGGQLDSARARCNRAGAAVLKAREGIEKAQIELKTALQEQESADAALAELLAVVSSSNPLMGEPEGAAELEASAEQLSQ